MSESESPYKVQGSRVYGNGNSYNVTNKVTAEQLCNTLNQYEKCATEYKTIEKKLDHVTKQIIQIQMSCSIMSDELRKINEELQ